MIRLLPLALLAMTLEGCPSKQDIASASAMPGYIVTAQAVLNRNAVQPFTATEKAAVKKADDTAYALAVKLDGDQASRAGVLHRMLQGI